MRTSLAIHALFVASLLAVRASATTMTFTDVTTNAGITHLFTFPTSGGNTESRWMTGGAVAEDFNGDGWTDLYVLQCASSTNLLYMNRGDGTFTNEAVARGADIRNQCVGAAAADYDNDGDIDIAVSSLLNTIDDETGTLLTNGTFVLVNDGTGTFTRTELTLTTWEGEQRFQSMSFGDLDNDGLLELAMAQWYGSRRSLFFFKGANLQQTNLFNPNDQNFSVFSPAFADFNGDRRADVAVVSDFSNSHFYVNSGLTGTNTLVRADSSSGDILTDENGMGCAIGDYDNDGDLDWFVSSIYETNNLPFGNWGFTGNRLYKNNGKGVFTDATDEAGVRDGNWGWGSYFGDLDNDGDLDLFHVNGFPETAFDYEDRWNNQPARLFENNGDGTFDEVAAAAGADDTGQGRGTILFDFDNDGDLDIFIANNQELITVGTNVTRNPGPPRLLRNDTPATNRWLNVLLSGTPPFHRNGIGSRAYVRIGTNTQMRELNASTGFLAHGPNRIAHFGLGTNTFVEEVRAEWVGGDATVKWNVPSNTTVTLPSPRATLSTNSLRPGQLLVAEATNVPPLGTHREWVVDGVTNADPYSAAFYDGTNRELRLNIYDTNSAAILFSELRRVTVRTVNVAILSPVSSNRWNILWTFDAGRIFKMQMATNVNGPWEDASTTQTSFGVGFATVTSAAPSALFRVLELGP